MGNNIWQLLKGNLLNALIGIVPGVYILLIAIGVISVEADAISVPAWIVFMVGITFIVAGVSVLGQGIFSILFRNILGGIIVTVFYLLALWISAGPGERVFVQVDPMVGRVIFGASAILLFFVTVIAWRMVLVSWRIHILVIVIVSGTFVCLGYWWHDKENSIDPTLFEVSQEIVSNTNHVYTVERIWDYPFASPRALAVDSEGNIYVSETYKAAGDASRILKFNPEGTVLGWWGKGNKTSGWHDSTSNEWPTGIGRAPGEFVYIMKITFDNAGNMYVVDRGTYFDTSDAPQVISFDTVQRYDRAGRFSGMIYDTTSGWLNEHRVGTETNISEPTCIIVSGDDLLVGSYDDNRLNKFSLTTGKLQEWFGKSEYGTYGWHAPAVDSVSAPYFGSEIGAFSGLIDCEKRDDQLYVVSYNSNPVIGVFDYKTGEYITGLSHSDGHKPQEMIVDTVGKFIFSDNYEGSVKFFDRDNKQLDSLQLGPGGNYFAVGDFALAKNGNVLFIEQQRQQLYELRVPFLQ